MENVQPLKQKQNKLLTGILILLIVICGILVFQVARGERANLFGYQIYYVLTGSMEPEIETGSSVIVRAVEPDTLEEGDVITFSSRDPSIYGMQNTHRIIQIETDDLGQKTFITKGDANPMEDRYPVYSEDILGKVVYHTNALKIISLFMKFLHTRGGFTVTIILPLMLVTFFYVRDFTRSVKEVLEEEARKAVEQEIDSGERKLEERDGEERADGEKESE